LRDGRDQRAIGGCNLLGEVLALAHQLCQPSVGGGDASRHARDP
jgi:hypothetical protein